MYWVPPLRGRHTAHLLGALELAWRDGAGLPSELVIATEQVDRDEERAESSLSAIRRTPYADAIHPADLSVPTESCLPTFGMTKLQLRPRPSAQTDVYTHTNQHAQLTLQPCDEQVQSTSSPSPGKTHWSTTHPFVLICIHSRGRYVKGRAHGRGNDRLYLCRQYIYYGVLKCILSRTEPPCYTV
jgi:hypothetical protein